MTLLWPSMLLLLLFVPVIVGLYLRLDRRRRSAVAMFSQGKPAVKHGHSIRRHLPAGLFLLGLVILLIALARPQAEVKLPRVEGTVILVMDVSASMGAQDMELSRMDSAKKSAREFVNSQPETIKIGIVSFSGSGFAVQTPTSDKNILLATIDRLEPTKGTSLGQGILAALNSIAMDAGLKTADIATLEGDSASQNSDQDNAERVPPEADILAQLPAGEYPSSVIVVLSDGEDNQSIDPIVAAQAAADHSVRIDALGFGTTSGTTLELDGFIVHTALNEALLQHITQVGGGTYFSALDEGDPQAVYANLTPHLVVKSEKMELTALLAGASIFVLLVGSVFSLLWFNRLV